MWPFRSKSKSDDSSKKQRKRRRHSGSADDASRTSVQSHSSGASSGSQKSSLKRSSRFTPDANGQRREASSSNRVGFSADYVVSPEESSSERTYFLSGRSVSEVVQYDIVLPLTNYAHKERESFHFQKGEFNRKYTAMFIFGCAQTALMLRRTEPLYGILVALLLEVAWVAFKWILYTAEDPALAQSYRFLRGWAVFACHQGSECIEHGRLRQLAPALMAAPLGTKIGKTMLHRMNEHMNANMMQNM